jgi:nucleoside-diphosphate-sugar epimerase
MTLVVVRNVALFFFSGIISRMLKGELPLVPEMHMTLVDVRDVARAHILAMEKVLI